MKRDQYKNLEEKYNLITEQSNSPGVYWNEDDQKIVDRHVTNLIKNLPGSEYWIKYLTRNFKDPRYKLDGKWSFIEWTADNDVIIDDNPNDPDGTKGELDALYLFLIYIWDSLYEKEKYKIKRFLTPEEKTQVRDRTDIEFKKLYGEFLNSDSPEWRQWKVKDIYKKGSEDTGLDLTNLAESGYDQQMGSHWIETELKSFKERPGYRFFEKWLLRDGFYSTIESWYYDYFEDYLHNFEDEHGDDEEVDAETMAIDAVNDLLINKYEMFLKDVNSPEYKEWQTHLKLEPVYKKGSEETGLDLTSLLENKKEKTGDRTPDGESTLKIDEYGTKRWLNKDGKYHNRFGPAYEGKKGYKAWFISGKRHREDGPAVIWPAGHAVCPNGREEYYLDDKSYTYNDWKKEVKHRKNLRDIYKKGSEETGLDLTNLAENNAKVPVDFTSLETVYNSLQNITNVNDFVDAAKQIYNHHNTIYNAKVKARQPIGTGYVRLLDEFISNKDPELSRILNTSYIVFGHLRSKQYRNIAKDKEEFDKIIKLSTDRLNTQIQEWLFNKKIKGIYKKGGEDVDLDLQNLEEVKKKYVLPNPSTWKETLFLLRNYTKCDEKDIPLVIQYIDTVYRDEYGFSNEPGAETVDEIVLQISIARQEDSEESGEDWSEEEAQQYVINNEIYKKWLKIRNAKLKKIYNKGGKDIGLDLGNLVEQEEKNGDVTPDGESRLEITSIGNKFWYNKKNEFHNRFGPAIEVVSKGGFSAWPEGKYWYINDKLHRADGPAIELKNGNKYWYINGQRHNENGPAGKILSRQAGKVITRDFYWLNDTPYEYEDWKKEVEHKKSLKDIYNKGSEQSGLDLTNL